MTPVQKSYVNVDELMPQVSLEQVAAHYGVVLPELHRCGAEIRTRCFLACGRTQESSERAFAIRAESPEKSWYCHNYGCGKSGNLVSLCDWMKPGAKANGRPRGDRFKEIAKDLRAMATGDSPVAVAPVAAPAVPAPSVEAPPRNVPLKDSPNERARALVNLDAKFVVNPSEMTPRASAVVRGSRPRSVAFGASATCRATRATIEAAAPCAAKSSTATRTRTARC